MNLLSKEMKNRNYWRPEKSRLLILTVLGLIIAGFMLSSFIGSGTADMSSLCSFAKSSGAVADYSATPVQLQAIIHYATSRVTPQQSLDEISVTFDVLKSLSPCNFLVFGLGHDSLMWDALNPHGTTVFLEEDPKWIQTVLKTSPSLRAHAVRYRTQLQEADSLMSSYKTNPLCLPSKAYLRGNHGCELALTGLADEIYDKEWDLIMIDAPRGYFPEAPGRMGAIFSAAVMGRDRKGSGVTHVFLHDVDRKVEKAFAEEFLCRKYLVKSVGRLWHFELPPVVNVSVSGADSFC